MLFSIRHNPKKGDLHKSIYKVYSAETNDFINYYNTKKILLTGYNQSEWYSYPSILKYKNDEYIICNSDDFGKESVPLIFKKMDCICQY